MNANKVRTDTTESGKPKKVHEPKTEAKPEGSVMEGFLVCAPLRMAMVAVGSELRGCTECGASVTCAPSGILLMASNPGMVPLCMNCAVKAMETLPPAEFILAGSREVIDEEIASAVPNPFLKESTK